MKQLTRRDFIKTSSILALPISQSSFGSETQDLEQKIIINLPSYSLDLINFENGKFREQYSFEVGIGKGSNGRAPTPLGNGFISDKREKVIFRYGADYPLLNLKKGDIIRWTNTFDENGKPQAYKMPYNEIRGLGMKIKDQKTNKEITSCVIHSTTDEFTLGTPCSSGCIRVGMNDMVKLYDLINPELKTGNLKNPIPLNILYDLVEFRYNFFKLHADIYNKPQDYIEKFKQLAQLTNFSDSFFNYSKLEDYIEEDKQVFKQTHEEILNTLAKPYPKNFVPRNLKSKLHKTYFFKELKA
ncbi:MAG: L,D-transpeptidase [Nanoarchaeota archaeon]|nr:L,D-transpeptidase [Nanoarchaeota archaeon]